MRVASPLWADLVLAFFRLAKVLAEHKSETMREAAARRMLERVEAASTHKLLILALEARQAARKHRRQPDTDTDELT